MDGQCLLGTHGASLINRGTKNVENATQCGLADRNADRRAGCIRFDATLQSIGRIHRHRANDVTAEMALDFQNQGLIHAFTGDLNSFKNFRQFS